MSEPSLSPSVDPVRERLQELRRVCNPATTTPLPWHCDSLVAGGYVINYETDHPAAGFVAEIADYGYDAALFIEAASKHMPSMVAALTAVLDVCQRFEDRAAKDAELRGFADPAAYAGGNTIITTSLTRLEIRSALSAAGLGVTP